MTEHPLLLWRCETLADKTFYVLAGCMHEAVGMAEEYLADVDDNLVTITDRLPGARADIDAGIDPTGFIFDTTQEGDNQQTVYLKSTGTSQVMVAVAPH